jgi:hypothetical protein
MSNKNQNILAQPMYYVYVLIDPRNSQPFYVGKGKGERVKRHYYNWSSVDKSNIYKRNKINKLKQLGYEPKYEIVFESNDESLVYQKEKQLIAQWGRFGYDKKGILTNINPGGEGNTGGKRAVKQYNLFGEYIQTFSSCLEAAQTLGKKYSSFIIECCKKKRKSKAAWDYFWSYAEDELDLNWCFGGKKKPVYQWDLQGNFIARHINASQAAAKIKKLKCSSEILKCAKTGKGRCNNFQWTFNATSPGVYKKIPKPTSIQIHQLALDGTFIKSYSSFYKANITLNKSGRDNEISRAIKRGKGIAYGYKWILAS